MGEYWKLANFTRKQFIHPHTVGNGLKFGEWAEYESDVIRRARELLSCGAWAAADEIAAVSDYAGRRNAIDLTVDPEVDITKVWAERIDGPGIYQALATEPWVEVSVGQTPASQAEEKPATGSKLEPTISLRDHFAGLAMQTLLTGALRTGAAIDLGDQIYADAYKVADAMLAAREAKS